MYKIIELEIDPEISGDTGVFEVAWVEYPAIEQELMYFAEQKFFRAPDNVSAKACRAIKENEKRGNPASTQVGKVRGQQLCNQDEISLETIKRMKSYLERAATYYTGDYDDNGTIAYDLWGGKPSLDWVNRILKQEENLGIQDFVKPNQSETQDEFIQRCIPVLIQEGKTPEQAAGQCYGQWENREFAEVGPKGGIRESKKAPKSTTPNKDKKGEGTAKGKATDTRSAEVTEKVEKILQDKSDEFNEKYKDKLGYGVNLGMLKSVYQRGVGAYNTSHSPAVNSSQQWALARVNAFLYLVKNGRPENSKYTTDYDLLPSEHPKKDKFAATRVSFDWDDTLETARGQKLLEQELSRGSVIYIISARNIPSREMYDLSLKYSIPSSHIFTEGSNIDKIEKIKELGITRHYDNNFQVIKDLGTIGVKFDYDITGLPDYDNYPASGDTDAMLVKPFLYDEDCGCYASDTELNVFGYNTQYFYICPGAVGTFEHLMEMTPESDTIGMIRSAAQIADNVFRIEADVLESENASVEQVMEAQVLVDDFKDLMNEIDEELGMVHDVSYMDGHIKTISSYLTDEYTDEEFESLKLLKFIAETDFEKFESVMGSLRGSTESEIMQRKHDKPVFYFKYDRVLDGFPDRDFCMSIEDRYFRRFEIDLLQDTNKEFGHKKQAYSKWLYKGGPNCVHAWRRFIYTPKEKNKEAQLKDLGMVSGKPGTPPKQMPNNGYYNEETKKASEIAYIISQQNMNSISYMKDIECAFGDLCKFNFNEQQMFSTQDEERMIYTPLMIPNILIPRIDEISNEKYYVRFKPDVIKNIRDKFMSELRNRKTNLEHTKKKFDDVVMVETWIVQGNKDKAYELGFTKEQIPVGTWMGAYKVLDTDEGDFVWDNYIKPGKIRGASVEGNFILNFSRTKEDEYLLEQVINILKQITD
jgi:hypothetical protein